MRGAGAVSCGGPDAAAPCSAGARRPRSGIGRRRARAEERGLGRRRGAVADRAWWWGERAGEAGRRNDKKQQAIAVCSSCREMRRIYLLGWFLRPHVISHQGSKQYECMTNWADASTIEVTSFM